MNEVGELPSGWTLAPLRDVAIINPANPASVPADDTLVSFVPMAAVQELSGRMNANTPRPWSHVKKGFTRFQEGDVVFAKITPSMENGKVALAANLFNSVAAGTTEFHVFRPQPGVINRYLLHYLLQETFRRRARARMTGTAGQLRVPTQFLEEEVLPLPPTSEQQRIIDSIDSYLTRLDDAVASLERVQAKLRAYRASVLNAAVEGRLVPTEASLARAEKREYEPAEVLLARILKERRRRWAEAELARNKAAGKTPKDDRSKAKYEEPVAADTSTLPELPEGWCWTSCAQVLLRLQTGPFGSSIHKSDYVTGGTPVINPQHLQDYGVHPSDQVTVAPATVARLSVFRLSAGDVVLGRRGEMGRCALIGPREDGWLLGTGSLALRLVEGVETDYFTWVLRSPRTVRILEGESVGTTMTNLNQTILLALPVPLPPAAEQARIVEEIERHVSVIEKLEVIGATQQTRCSRERQAILKWAFEGKLVDQDPTDEPAEELLARIRAARAVVGPTTTGRARTVKGAV